MKHRIGIAAFALACSVGAAGAQDATMSFFVTSVNPGSGGDLGGLEGADAYCTALAEAAGVSREDLGRLPVDQHAWTRATASARGRGSTPPAW